VPRQADAGLVPTSRALAHRGDPSADVVRGYRRTYTFGDRLTRERTYVTMVTMPSGHRPQPPVGTARVAISGHGQAGNPWVNVFWLNLTATTHTAADLKNIVDSMVAAYATRLMANASNVSYQTGAKATWLYASNQAIEYQGSYSNVGGQTGTALPDSSCVVIDWSIADYYRGGHPRTYLAVVSNSVVGVGRNIGSTFSATLATAANGFISDVNALTHGGISAVGLGTVRFASGNAWLSPPVFRGYLSASVRPILGTQRRRLAA
jgi:hypothetical protein